MFVSEFPFNMLLFKNELLNLTINNSNISNTYAKIFQKKHGICQQSKRM